MLDVQFGDVNFDGYDDLLILYSDMSSRLISDTSIWPTGVTVALSIRRTPWRVSHPLPVRLRLLPNRDNDIEFFAFRDDVTTLFHIDPLSNAITASPLGTDGLNGIICQDVQLAHYDADGYPEIVCLEADGPTGV